VPNDRPRQIVGIVKDHRLSPFDEDVMPVMYTLHTQQPSQYLWPRGELRLGMSFLVKTRDMANVVPALRRVIADIDRDRPISNIHPLEQDLANRFTSHRYVMTLFGTFASVATFLAAIGIYGVMAFTVARRSREIGIRMALGAGTRHVLRPAHRLSVHVRYRCASPRPRADARPRHGYELSKLIHTRSRGQLTFHLTYLAHHRAFDGIGAWDPMKRSMTAG
jgi:hypothetical protein